MLNSSLSGPRDITLLRQFENVVQGGALWTRFDAIHSQAEQESADWAPISVGAASVVSGLSAGYLMWALRSGYLLAGLASSAPAWREFDPLSVLNSSIENNAHDDDESLEEIISSGG